MSNQGCQTPRATIFNTVAALSNINIVCSANAALGNAQKTNFAPRVGFAYKLRPTLVVRGGFGTAYGALGNLGYGGTLGLNYPFGYTQTIPSPDSNHPLLAGSSNAPATLENTFNNFNFNNPTVLQSPTPYTTHTGFLRHSAPQPLRGRPIHRQRLSRRDSQRPPVQLPDAADTDGEPDRRGSVHEPRRDPGGLCRHPGPSPGYSGDLEQQLHNPAPRHQHPVLYSVPVHGAERHLRNHQRQHQLQLHADHVSAPDELWAFGAGQLHLVPVLGRPARAAELGVQLQVTAPSGWPVSASKATTASAMPTPPTCGTPPPPTTCLSAVASSLDPP